MADNTVYSGLESTIKIYENVDKTISTNAYGDGVVRVEAEAPGTAEVVLGNEIDGKHAWATNVAGWIGTDKVGDYYELSFYGVGIGVVYFDGKHPSCRYEVYVDGVLQGTIAPTYQSIMKTFSVSGLVSGKHTVRVLYTAAGPSGVGMVLDAFDILPSSLLTLPNEGSAEADVQLYVEPAEKEYHADFLGKTPGSTTANKHKASYSARIDTTPNGAWTELGDYTYGNVAKLDGKRETGGGQYLFSFDQLPIHSDIEVLRGHTTELDLNYFGYGYGINNGADNHEAEILLWNKDTSAWDSQGYAGMGFSRASVATVDNSVFTEVLTFAGKTAGQTNVCPHTLKVKTLSTFDSPASFTAEAIQSYYNGIITANDGVVYSREAAAGGTTWYAQQLFSFDLLTWLRNRFPYLGSVDVATLKTLVKSLKATWVGNGSGEHATTPNGVTLKSWSDGSWAVFATPVSSTPTATTYTFATVTDKIDTEGKFHLLAHSTNPASATTPSIINTDYVQLEVTVDLSTVRAGQPRYVGGNYGLLFPTTEAKVDLGNRDEFNFQEGTIEFNFCPKDGTSAQSVISRISYSAPARGLQLYRSAATAANRFAWVVYYDKNDGTSASETLYLDNVPLGKYSHAVMTFTEAGVMSAYLNGTLVITKSISGFKNWKHATDQNMVIGGFVGSADDARIWNVARTPEEILANYNKPLDLTKPQPGLVCYLPCDEGSGSIVQDKAPRQNLLTKEESSFEDGGLGGWVSGSGTAINTTEQAWHGNKSVKFTPNGAGSTETIHKTIAALPNKAYSVSWYVYIPTGDVVECAVDQQNGGAYIAVLGSTQRLTGNNTWQRFTISGVTASNCNALRFITRRELNADITPWYVDGLMLNEGPTPAGWVEGGEKYQAQGVLQGCTWTHGAFGPPWGKAILVEEGTSNLLTANQSSVETDTSGFSARGSGVTITRDTSTAWHGSACLKVVTDGTAIQQGVLLNCSIPTQQTPYTFSAYLCGSGKLRITCSDATSPWGGLSNNIELTNQWQRFSVTFTPSAGVATLALVIDTQDKLATTFYVDGLQLE